MVATAVLGAPPCSASFRSGGRQLDEHQVRAWTSWYRITLAMLAHAFLVVTTAAQRQADITDNALITLTVNEFRRRCARSSASTPSMRRWRRPRSSTPTSGRSWM